MVGSVCLVGVPNAYAVVTWTYNAGTNTATASGAGSTTLTALVAADTAGGWGKFTADASGSQITLGGKVVIGDGTNACVCTASNQQIILAFTAWGSHVRFTVANASTMQFGTLVTNYSTSLGCDIINHDSYAQIAVNTGATMKLYSTKCSRDNANWVYSFTNGGSGTGGVVIAYNCIFDWGGLFDSLTNSNNDFYNVLFTSDGSSVGTSYTGCFYKSSGTMNVIRMNAVGIPAYAESGGSFTIKNGVFQDTVDYIAQMNGVSADSYFINCDSDNWSIYWRNSCTKALYRQYEYDLTVLNGEITDFVEDANVTLSKNGVLIGTWLTNSSGQIDTQTLTYGFYNQTGGDTMYDGSYPFVLTVTHPDWADYTSRFYVTEKTKMTISMQELDAVVTANNNATALFLLVIFAAAGFGMVLLFRRSS